MSNMSHRDGSDFNKAPGQVGRTDIGYENLEVKVILWPDEQTVAKVLSKASVAVRGSIVEDDTIDEAMVADMFKGGLNQALEWFTVAFEVSGVSRGVTHQLVRTRKASFAQQSLRYADMGNFNVRMPMMIYNSEVQDPVVDETKYPMLTMYDDLVTPEDVWMIAIETAREAYRWLADHGIPMQDTRTVCPISTETYIICEYPLSEFLNTYSYRACNMFYPETVALFRMMRDKLLEKCPWLEPHIKISCEKTKSDITVNGALLPHKCTYQGWERVEGECNFPWALEVNRTYKSTKVDR